MRILVTGKTGQIGSAMVPLVKRFGTVIATDREMLDLAKPKELAAKLDSIAPDLIVNCAAYTAVDKAEDESELAFLVNATGPKAIAQWASANGAPFIHFSTDYVFSGSGQRPWREDDAASPINVYGASKLGGENAIREIGGTYLIVRTQWVYAASGNNFLSTMVRLFGQREELRVVSDQFGSPTSASCIANIIADIIQANIDCIAAAFSSVNQVMHLSASGETSWYGFAEAILNGMRRRDMNVVTQRLTPIATRDYRTRAARPSNCRLDLSRLKETFRIVPPSWRAVLDVELDRLAKDAV